MPVSLNNRFTVSQRRPLFLPHPPRRCSVLVVLNPPTPIAPCWRLARSVFRSRPAMPFTMPLTDISGLRPSLPGSLVVAWGNNRFGQLGVPETSDERERGRADFMQREPMIIPAFTDRPVSALSCRDHFCLALVAGDGVYGWGSADQGQLGDRRGAHMVSSPVRLAFTHQKAVVAIAAGSFHALALRQENIVRPRQSNLRLAEAHAWNAHVIRRWRRRLVAGAVMGQQQPRPAGMGRARDRPRGGTGGAAQPVHPDRRGQ